MCSACKIACWPQVQESWFSDVVIIEYIGEKSWTITLLKLSHKELESLHDWYHRPLTSFNHFSGGLFLIFPGLTPVLKSKIPASFAMLNGWKPLQAAGRLIIETMGWTIRPQNFSAEKQAFLKPWGFHSGNQRVWRGIWSFQGEKGGYHQHCH